ncbi:MAG: hypothetical protein NVS2B14_00140 [Chamaesiphon sp.]
MSISYFAISKELSADGFCWNQYSPRVGTITNELRHFSRVCYFAFEDWEASRAFWEAITSKGYCTRAQVRKAERFQGFDWEVKVWGMPQPILSSLIKKDLNRFQARAINRDWSISQSQSAIAYEARQ